MFQSLEAILQRSEARYKLIFEFFSKLDFNIISQCALKESHELFNIKLIDRATLEAPGLIRSDEGLSIFLQQFDKEFSKILDSFRLF